jgi:precorrin-6A/cobalt-precorrin-6A reductase
MPTILSHGGLLELVSGDCRAVVMTLRILILGGTSDARELGQRLASDDRYQVMVSFAGRTASIADPGVPYRVGGFGGVEGLVSHLDREGYHVLVDATHPFAAQMSRHAAAAAQRTGVPLLRLERSPWPAVPGDRWALVPHMEAAPAALGAPPKRVFLGIGRLEVGAFAAAPEHDYLVRAIDPFVPPLPRARVLTARGPFLLADERALFQRERIEVVVSKNAGTPSTYAKIEAARELGLPVVMVGRPSLPAVETAPSVEAALAWLSTCQRFGASIERGV